MNAKQHNHTASQTCEDLARELREVIADKDIIIAARDDEIRFLTDALQELVDKVKEWQGDHTIQAKRLLMHPKDINGSNHNQ